MKNYKSFFIILFIQVLCSLSFAQNVALVIIDMQPEFVLRNPHHGLLGNLEKLGRVLERQIELIRIAKKNGIPILLIEYNSAGNTLDELRDEIGNYEKATLFTKYQNGMFSNVRNVGHAIRGFLKKEGVTDLVIAGANGGKCVKCSINGALNSGYRVWADSNAIIDLNYEAYVLPYKYHLEEFRLNIDAFNQAEGGEIFDTLLSEEGSEFLSNRGFGAEIYVEEPSAHACGALLRRHVLEPFQRFFSW